jgi:hypothetical protein
MNLENLSALLNTLASNLRQAKGQLAAMDPATIESAAADIVAVEDSRGSLTAASAALETKAEELRRASATVETLTAERDQLRKELASATEWWHAPLRAELERSEYAQAFAAKDAAALFGALSAPGPAVLADPIPVSAVRAALNVISVRAEILGGGTAAKWGRICERATALLAGVTVVPRAEVAGVAALAIGENVLPDGYQVGVVRQSRLETLRLQAEVSIPAHISKAMRW